MPLRQGIPTIESYNDVLRARLFREMEVFSNQFLHSYRAAIREYSQAWVYDPLHQWSRQWEYPFVYVYIGDFLDQAKQDIAVLDAGCGFTFFPFYIASKYPLITMDCCDNDPSLESVFASIKTNLPFPVGFHKADLRELPFGDDTYNVIYCISVLEHTENFDAIFQEFKRVLRPDGRLIITFDISLDGSGDMHRQRAIDLVETAERYFHPVDHFNSKLALRKLDDQATILMTRYIAKINRKLLPWRQSRLSVLKSLLGLHRLQASYKNLTCFCQVLKQE